MKYVFSIINKLVAVLEIMYTIKKKQKRNTHTTFSAVPVMIDKKKQKTPLVRTQETSSITRVNHVYKQHANEFMGADRRTTRLADR